jgi:hypothetical protein
VMFPGLACRERFDDVALVKGVVLTYVCWINFRLMMTRGLVAQASMGAATTAVLLQ